MKPLGRCLGGLVAHQRYFEWHMLRPRQKNVVFPVTVQKKVGTEGRLFFFFAKYFFSFTEHVQVGEIDIFNGDSAPNTLKL